MASVKLYDDAQLSGVHGLHVQKALAKMGGNLEVYSTLLDKYLNEIPRTIPRIKSYIRDKKTKELAQELRDLRIDLADIYALEMFERAGIMYEAAEKGDLMKCEAMRDVFISALQSLSYEIKQCRTQELLENAEDAAVKASELDIGVSIVNNKYSTIPKAKFYELHKRIDAGLMDKALNLAKVLKAMGYDSEISSLLSLIAEELNNFQQKKALQNAAKLIVLLGGTPPVKAPEKFRLLVVDTGELAETVKSVLGDKAVVSRTRGVDDTLRHVRGEQTPDFVLISKKLSSHDGMTVAGQIRKANEIPMGIVLTNPTAQDILSASKLGIRDFFTLPLDKKVFAEKLEKYIESHARTG